MEHVLSVSKSPFRSCMSFQSFRFDFINRKMGFSKAKMIMDQNTTLGEVSTVTIDQLTYFVNHVDAVKQARQRGCAAPEYFPLMAGRARELMR